MAEAGYPNGFSVDGCPNDRYVNDDRICQTVAANLSRINVKINLQAETRAPISPGAAPRHQLLHAGLDALHLRCPQRSQCTDGLRG